MINALVNLLTIYLVIAGIVCAAIIVRGYFREECQRYPTPHDHCIGCGACLPVNEEERA